MLLFDALSSRIRIVKIRGRSLVCTVCAEHSSFTEQEFQRFDYEKFTQSPMSDKSNQKLSLLPENARVTSRKYKEVVDSGESHILLDVRPAHHFKIVSIPQSVNIPLSILEDKLSAIDSYLKDAEDGSRKLSSLYVVCRRGNDSQRAVQLLHKNGFLSAKDIIGGLESWAQDVDPKFPAY